MERPPLLSAERGNGCSHCETGVPIDHIRTRRGHTIHLCLQCVLRWYWNKDVAWWEGQHAPFIDHVDVALAKAHWKQLQEAYMASKRPPRMGLTP